MKRMWVVVSLLGIGGQLYAAKAYVTNTNNNTVTIFDTVTNTVTGIVQDPNSTFNSPQQVAITPNGQTVYVVNQGTGFSNLGSVSVINVATDTVTQVVTDLVSPTFNGPIGIALTPDGTKAYVTNNRNSTVTVFDTTTNRVITTVTDDLVSPTFNGPIGVAFTPDGTKAYVVNENSSSVSVIDVATNSVNIVTPVVTDIGSFNGPWFVAFTPDGTTAYVTNNGGVTVSVINVATNTVLQTVSNPNFNGPFGVAFTQDGTTAYVVNGTGAFPGPLGGSVSIVDVATNTVTAMGLVSDAGVTFDRPLYIAIVPTVTPPSVSSPVVITGVHNKNVFLTQTDYINVISWTVPSSITPVSYNVYRDAALTNLVGSVTVSPTTPLQIADHNRNPRLSYTYYLVGVSAAGTATLLGSVTVLGSFNNVITF